MNINDIILRQTIGIYYKDLWWAIDLFKEITENLPDEIIVKKIMSKYNMFIQLKDDVLIRFVSANSDMRGYRFTKIFLEPGIDKEYYDCIIRPYLISNYPIILNENLSNADLWYKNTQDEEAIE